MLRDAMEFWGLKFWYIAAGEANVAVLSGGSRTSLEWLLLCSVAILNAKAADPEDSGDGKVLVILGKMPDRLRFWKTLALLIF